MDPIIAISTSFEVRGVIHFLQMEECSAIKAQYRLYCEDNILSDISVTDKSGMGTLMCMMSGQELRSIVTNELVQKVEQVVHEKYSFRYL